MSGPVLFQASGLAERMQLARDWALIVKRASADADAAEKLALDGSQADQPFHDAFLAADEYHAEAGEALAELLALLTAPEMQAEIHALKGGA